jgi:membrane-bound serine protease (ClpP class)
MGSFLFLKEASDLDVGLSFYDIAPIAVIILILFILISFIAIKSNTARVRSGREGLIGSKGVALSDFSNGEGRVMVAGENWAAVSWNNSAIRKDQKIEVCEVRDGLELVVKEESHSARAL